MCCCFSTFSTKRDERGESAPTNKNNNYYHKNRKLQDTTAKS
jgi:hypothetical protein